MVVHIALPKVAGSAREQEISVAPAEAAVAPAGSVRGAEGRSLQPPILVPLLVVTEAVWLAVLGYGILHFLA